MIISNNLSCKFNLLIMIFRFTNLISYRCRHLFGRIFSLIVCFLILFMINWFPLCIKFYYALLLRNSFWLFYGLWEFCSSFIGQSSSMILISWVISFDSVKSISKLEAVLRCLSVTYFMSLFFCFLFLYFFSFTRVSYFFVNEVAGNSISIFCLSSE